LLPLGIYNEIFGNTIIVSFKCIKMSWKTPAGWMPLGIVLKLDILPAAITKFKSYRDHFGI